MAAFKWRKLNTVKTSYVSSYPAGVWVITAPKQAGQDWQLKRANDDGDPYEVVSEHPTVKEAMKAAEEWRPADGA